MNSLVLNYYAPINVIIVFCLTAKFSEGTIPFTSQTLPLLQDTFLILAENESAYHTKINQRKQANLEDDFNEELQAAEGQDEITDAHKATLKVNIVADSFN